MQRILRTGLDPVLRRHAFALDLDRIKILSKTGKRRHRPHQQHKRHYHAPSMTPLLPALRRPLFAAYGLAFACGPVGAWLALYIGIGLGATACTPPALLTLLLIAPIAEETVFRLGLHNWLLERLPTRWGALSLANVLVAVVFAALHALHQGSLGMLLTAAPALMLGWLWERSGRRLQVPIAAHAWFNLCLTLASCP